MSEKAYFYNSISGDRKYNADSFSSWLKQFFTDGILNGNLQVIANGDMTLTVNTGTALIGGKVKVFEEKKTLKLETASGTLNRIDNIVVRRDDDARDFTIEIVKGSPAAEPKPPALTRSGNIHELKLAEVRVNKGVAVVTQASVTDTRANRTLCGWIVGNTEKIPAEQLLKQMDTAFNEWFNQIKNQLTEDAAGNLQTQINDIKSGVSYGTKLPTTAKEGDIFILIES